MMATKRALRKGLFRKNGTDQWFVTVATCTNGRMAKDMRWYLSRWGEEPTELIRIGMANNMKKDGYLCKWGVTVEAYIHTEPQYAAYITEIINEIKNKEMKQ